MASDASDWRTMVAMAGFLGDPRPAWAKDEPHAPGCLGNEWEIKDFGYQPATPENGAIRDCFSFTSAPKPCTCGLRPQDRAPQADQ